MKSEDFLALIEKRLGDLETRLEAIADRQLTAEAKRAIDIARLPSFWFLINRVLDILVSRSGGVPSLAWIPASRPE